tara:strand:- start:1215 stop:1931 length:717 start_codon:yes stop_codon:yes gene_type:complete
MTQKVINIVLAFIILILIWKGCEIQREKNELVNQVSAYSIGEKAFNKKIQDDSSTIVTQTQTIMTQNDAIKLGLLKLEGQIKDVQSQVKESQEVIIKKVLVPFVPDNYIDTTKGWYASLKNGQITKSLVDSLIFNSLIVPRKFNKDDKWFTINGIVKKDGVMIDSIKIPNESSVTIGYKKSGFLNLGRTPIVEIKNTNPYIDVTKVSNIVTKKNRGIFNTKGFWVGVGVISGILIQKL